MIKGFKVLDRAEGTEEPATKIPLNAGDIIILDAASDKETLTGFIRGHKVSFPSSCGVRIYIPRANISPRNPDRVVRSSLRADGKFLPLNVGDQVRVILESSAGDDLCLVEHKGRLGYYRLSALEPNRPLDLSKGRAKSFGPTQKNLPRIRDLVLGTGTAARSKRKTVIERPFSFSRELYDRLDTTRSRNAKLKLRLAKLRKAKHKEVLDWALRKIDSEILNKWHEARELQELLDNWEYIQELDLGPDVRVTEEALEALEKRVEERHSLLLEARMRRINREKAINKEINISKEIERAKEKYNKLRDLIAMRNSSAYLLDPATLEAAANSEDNKKLIEFIVLVRNKIRRKSFKEKNARRQNTATTISSEFSRVRTLEMKLESSRKENKELQNKIIELKERIERKLDGLEKNFLTEIDDPFEKSRGDVAKMRLEFFERFTRLGSAEDGAREPPRVVRIAQKKSKKRPEAPREFLPLSKLLKELRDSFDNLWRVSKSPTLRTDLLRRTRQYATFSHAMSQFSCLNIREVLELSEIERIALFINLYNMMSIQRLVLCCSGSHDNFWLGPLQITPEQIVDVVLLPISERRAESDGIRLLELVQEHGAESVMRDYPAEVSTQVLHMFKIDQKVNAECLRDVPFCLYRPFSVFSVCEFLSFEGVAEKLGEIASAFLSRFVFVEEPEGEEASLVLPETVKEFIWLFERPEDLSNYLAKRVPGIPSDALDRLSVRTYREKFAPMVEIRRGDE